MVEICFEIAHWQNSSIFDSVICLQHDNGGVLSFQVLFFPFSICHSNVNLKEFRVKNFSGPIGPRILKVCTNMGFDLIYCARENQHPYDYHSFYLSIFLSFS